MQDEELSVEEAKERKIMKLLLKVKNGTPPQRKSALRQLTDKARDFGAGPLFNQILPLLMAPTLEDQERHLLVKVGQRRFVIKHALYCAGKPEMCPLAGSSEPGGAVMCFVVPFQSACHTSTYPPSLCSSDRHASDCTLTV